MPWKVVRVPAGELEERLNSAESRGFYVKQVYPDPRDADQVVVVAWQRSGSGPRPNGCSKCGRPVKWVPGGRGGSLAMDPQTMNEHGCPAPSEVRQPRKGGA